MPTSGVGDSKPLEPLICRGLSGSHLSGLAAQPQQRAPLCGQRGLGHSARVPGHSAASGTAATGVVLGVFQLGWKMYFVEVMESGVGAGPGIVGANGNLQSW